MQTEQLTRAFRYNSVDLVDPGAQYSPEQVRDFYSAAYPEIVSAGIDKQIIRTDTRSGVMEACSIVGEEVKCSQLKEKK